MAPGIAPKPQRSKTIEPSPDIILAISNVDYSIEAAIADLIDNSIDAGCTTVLVRVVGGSHAISHLLVVDDGKGMSSASIDEAMEFGRRRGYDDDDLGLYGMGLKSASLSQASVMTVYSRFRGGNSVGRQWTMHQARKGWQCGVMSSSDSRVELNANWIDGLSTRLHGTVVRWDDIRRFRQATGNVDAYLKRFFNSLGAHLGLVFHRHLAAAQLSVVIDYFNTETNSVGFSKSVYPLDPFGYPRTGHPRFPADFEATIGSLALVATAHVWPKGHQKDPNYKLIGNVAQRQGFYLYRNDRLIQAGGWNGLRMDGEPHLSLARVAIDLPTQADDTFQVRYTKSSVDVPQEFVESIRASTARDGRTFDQYLGVAQDLYRTRGERSVPRLNPANGLPIATRKAISDSLGTAKRPPFQVRVGRIAGGGLFNLDISRSKLTVSRSLLKSASKEELENTVLVLSYLLLQETFKLQRMTATSESYIAALSMIASSVVSNRE